MYIAWLKLLDENFRASSSLAVQNLSSHIDAFLVFIVFHKLKGVVLILVIYFRTVLPGKDDDHSGYLQAKRRNQKV